MIISKMTAYPCLTLSKTMMKIITPQISLIQTIITTNKNTKNNHNNNNSNKCHQQSMITIITYKINKTNN
jgi:hypothetical protein